MAILESSTPNFIRIYISRNRSLCQGTTPEWREIDYLTVRIELKEAYIIINLRS